MWARLENEGDKKTEMLPRDENENGTETGEFYVDTYTFLAALIAPYLPLVTD